MRAKARADALNREHRLPLSTGAGQGRLAEALNILLDEARVEAELVDDPLNGPLMIYRPIALEALQGFALRSLAAAEAGGARTKRVGDQCNEGGMTAPSAHSSVKPSPIRL